ncbi:MAG: hypothetical protein KBD63_02680 [Bacteriovoracaceae bacterium]|nr:hypothetical protein [Bacteriovoracaceae bacterium]
MPANVTLEVSSPGLERGLRTLTHFEWALGKKVKVVLNSSLALPDLPKKYQGQKQMTGILCKVLEKEILLELDAENKCLIDFLKIKRANLEVDWNSLQEV